MGPNTKHFLVLIEKFRLADRYPEVESVVRQIEMGLVSETIAKMYIGRIQPLIEKQKRCFNPLAKVPTQEELGEFDIEVGTLMENPTVRTGSSETKEVSHSMVASVTGGGKSTLLRKKICALSEHKRNLDATR